MILIKKHISDLLYLYDCVIVPGFGAFVANYQNVLICEKQNLLFPPSKEIGFNRYLSHNDGLLAYFISKKESISYSEAVEKVRRFVKDINLELLSGKEVSFDRLGSCRKDATGNLIFIPNEEYLFLPESYGLTSLRFTLLKQKNLFSKIEFTKDANLAVKNYSIRYRAAAAAVIACFLFFSTDLKMPNINQAGVSADTFNIYENMIELPTEMEEDNEIGSENFELKIATDLKDENFELDINPKIKNSSKKYHLIVSSFPNNNLASKDLKSYKSKGFAEAKIIDNGSGRIRIALFSFSDKNEATTALEELRKQPQFTTAWLLAH